MEDFGTVLDRTRLRVYNTGREIINSTWSWIASSGSSDNLRLHRNSEKLVTATRRGVLKLGLN